MLFAVIANREVVAYLAINELRSCAGAINTGAPDLPVRSAEYGLEKPQIAYANGFSLL